jgi:hypothetical protein
VCADAVAEIRRFIIRADFNRADPACMPELIDAIETWGFNHHYPSPTLDTIRMMGHVADRRPDLLPRMVAALKRPPESRRVLTYTSHRR